jgi:hypothetical protein
VEVPFNLDVLRAHLGNASLFRRMLPNDALSRQYLLERSVLDIASERLKKVAEQIDKLGVQPDIKDHGMQAWIWSWHKKLVERLKEDIRKVRREESSQTKGAFLPLPIAFVCQLPVHSHGPHARLALPGVAQGREALVDHHPRDYPPARLGRRCRRHEDRAGAHLGR